MANIPHLTHATTPAHGDTNTPSLGLIIKPYNTRSNVFLLWSPGCNVMSGHILIYHLTHTTHGL